VLAGIDEAFADKMLDVTVLARVVPFSPPGPASTDGVGGALRISSGRLKVYVKIACLIPLMPR
jgi:hypothetical protein